MEGSETAQRCEWDGLWKISRVSWKTIHGVLYQIQSGKVDRGTATTMSLEQVVVVDVMFHT